MSIRKSGWYYWAVCDQCGVELPEKPSYMEAVDAKKTAGWSPVMVNGAWRDTCPECGRVENEKPDARS